MIILLTGANGMLGSAIRAAAAAKGDSCHALARAQVGMLLPMAEYDVIIHAAANTDVELCEKKPEESYRDNFLLTETLALAAAKASVRLIFISSTGVYGDHLRLPYREYHASEPTTHHHRSKLLAEGCVMRADLGNLVVRTGWLFGGDAANPKNFVARRIEEARQAYSAGIPLIANIEQRGVPCHSADIAERILMLARAGTCGLVNCINDGNASRFEYVNEIVSAMGLEIEISPCNSASFQRLARVSNNEMAENWKMDALGFPVMPDWQVRLRAYVDELLGTS